MHAGRPNHWLASMARDRISVAIVALLPASALATPLPAFAIDPEPGAAAPEAAMAASPSLDASLPADAWFNPSLLHAGTDGVDLSRFEQGNVTLPGTYRAQILVNGELAATQDVTFKEVAGRRGAQPCLDRQTLLRLGLDPAKLKANTVGQEGVLPLTNDVELACGDLSRYVPGATASFDQGEQALSISIPQVFMNSRARGYVSPEYWDGGVNAGMLSYNTNTYHTRDRAGSGTSTYVGLNAGVNLGGWRLRHLGSYTHSARSSSYQNNRTFAQHDLTALKAQLTIGDTYTPGELIDSVRIRGVAIGSDQRMLAPSQRGFAPTVRGIAQTNARVVVRQRGYIVYETTVAPGPFAIDDLYATGYNGDLDVTIIEADGREKYIRVPYASQPRLLRQGQTRFNVAAGQIKEFNLKQTPWVAQGTLQHGMSNAVTVYSGFTVGTSYTALMSGVALNTSMGSFALDVTGARAAMPSQRTEQGFSSRVSYSTQVAESRTNVGVAAHRFNSRGYVGVLDAARMRDDMKLGLGSSRVDRERNRVDLYVSQPLGASGGQLSLSGSHANFWNDRSRRLDYTVAYSNHWKVVDYNLQVQRSQISGDYRWGRQEGLERRRDTTVFLQLSVPLGASPSAPTFSSAVTHRAGESAGYQASVNGAIGVDRNISYGVSASRAGGSNGVTTGSANGTYRAPLATFSASAGRNSRGASQFSLGANGSVVAHANGITFSQELGESNAIVHAPGATGAMVEGYAGLRLDRWGNAVIPNLSPYQLNELAIDPRGSSSDVELASTSGVVAPRAGAMVRLDYETRQGTAAMVHASRTDGKPLPFGAQVYDAEGNSVGVVGQGSNAFVRGNIDGAELTVRWSDGVDGQCRIRMPESVSTIGHVGMHRTIDATCTHSESSSFSAQASTSFSMH